MVTFVKTHFISKHTFNCSCGISKFKRNLLWHISKDVDFTNSTHTDNDGDGVIFRDFSKWVNLYSTLHILK